MAAAKRAKAKAKRPASKGDKNPPEKPGASKGLPPWLTPGNPGNSGGKPGRSGRPSNAFRNFCRNVLADPEVQIAAYTAARSPWMPGYSTIIRTLAQGAGELVMKHTHDGDGEGGPILVKMDV